MSFFDAVGVVSPNSILHVTIDDSLSFRFEIYGAFEV